LIRKLFAGVSVLAVAVVALLLMTVGTSANAKPAEATVANIGATVSQVGVNTFALVQVNAQDEFWDFPNSPWDLDITASAGEFLELDPTGLAPGCTDQLGSPSSPRCAVNSNGFGQSNTFAPGGGTVGTTVNTSTFTDTLSILNSFATGTTHIQVCNNHGYEPDAWAAGDPAATAQPGNNPCNNNTSHVEAWWQAPPGFLGGAVTFCATQTNTVCFNLTVVGPVASLELHAFRNASTETSQCKGTDVFVIASADYSFNDATTFDNNRAVLCVEARDSNGTLVNNQNIVWTTTKGVLGSNVTNTGGPPANVNNANNTLSSGGSAASGDIAHVVANIGSASASVDVQFGGDPVSCSIPDFPSTLDIGDHAHFVATFVDSKGNWVPDGIVGHLVEVDSGDGADNVQLVSVTEDTVKGKIEGDVIGAISGLTTIAASVEHLAGADPTCSEALELTGDVHVTPIVCDDPDMILNGFPPPAGGGFGTFEFCGGTYDQLLAASKCPKATSAFFYNKPSGSFAVWIPGSEVAAVNEEFMTIFPNQHVPIPAGTIFTAKCK
jgi:hypothetical protein